MHERGEVWRNVNCDDVTALCCSGTWNMNSLPSSPTTHDVVVSAQTGSSPTEQCEWLLCKCRAYISIKLQNNHCNGGLPVGVIAHQWWPTITVYRLRLLVRFVQVRESCPTRNDSSRDYWTGTRAWAWSDDLFSTNQKRSRSTTACHWSKY